MAGGFDPEAYTWLNLGVESASGELLVANGCRGKMGPCEPEEWGEFCLQQVRRLVKAGFFPLVSLMIGLPGERPEDVAKTIQWVSHLRDERAAVFPLLYAPTDDRSRRFGAGDMSAAHWRLFRACYRLNFQWVPRLCWDNQSAAGVSLRRRLTLQGMGRVRAAWWRALFTWKSRVSCQ